jgi:hypothetical protein
VYSKDAVKILSNAKEAKKTETGGEKEQKP